MGMELIAEIRRELMDQLSRGEEWTDQEIREKIDDLVIQRTRKSTLTVTEKARMGRELFYSVRKLDVLQELLEDDSVTEIMVNGFQNIFVERDGQRTRWEKSFTSREKLEDVIQQIAGKCNRVINENQPIVDARLSGGQRVNAVVYPVALDGPVLTIRRFPNRPITMDWLIRKGSISRGVSGKGGAGRLLDSDRGRNLLGKDHFPECPFQLHSCGRTAYYDRGQRGTPDSGCGKSGPAGGKNGQYGRQPGDHHTGSDTDSSADGAEPDCCGRDPGRGGH